MAGWGSSDWWNIVGFGYSWSTLFLSVYSFGVDNFRDNAGCCEQLKGLFKVLWCTQCIEQEGSYECLGYGNLADRFFAQRSGIFE